MTHLVAIFCRIIYILYKFLSDLGSAFSRLFNASVLGGSTDMTTSARTHYESYTKPSWAKARLIINWCAFLQEDHCKSSWEAEDTRSTKVKEISSWLKGFPDKRPEIKDMYRDNTINYYNNKKRDS